jgi:hypothetical protein
MIAISGYFHRCKQFANFFLQIIFWHKYLRDKLANFFTNFFGENIFKNNNVGPWDNCYDYDS